MKRLRPLDYIIILVLLCASVFSIIANRTKPGTKIQVNANGQKYEYSLKQNGIYTVPGPLGNTVFEIKDGRVRIIDSPCHGKQCVHQGWHLPLVCLPNKVIITAEQTGEFDAISE
ncbi:MAG: NusG domain II-containing protein [Treponema sp.]|nr:NusG domain II-containing protein [Treponema sp.]